MKIAVKETDQLKAQDEALKIVMKHYEDWKKIIKPKFHHEPPEYEIKLEKLLDEENYHLQGSEPMCGDCYQEARSYGTIHRECEDPDCVVSGWSKGKWLPLQ